MAKSEPIRLETERLQDTICRELDLVDVQWESCWEISFKRGVLASFQNLLKAHEVIKGMTELAQIFYQFFNIWKVQNNLSSQSIIAKL